VQGVCEGQSRHVSSLNKVLFSAFPSTKVRSHSWTHLLGARGMHWHCLAVSPHMQMWVSSVQALCSNSVFAPAQLDWTVSGVCGASACRQAAGATQGMGSAAWHCRPAWRGRGPAGLLRRQWR